MGADTTTGTTRRESTCSAILDATSAVIAEKGIEGFTISHVAERANVNRALVYHYYKDRDTLVDAAINHVLAQYDEAENDMSPEVLERGVRQLLDHPEFCRFFIQLMLDRRPLRSLGNRFVNTIASVEEYKRLQGPDVPVDITFGTIAVLLTTLTWATAREQISELLDIPVDEADERLIALFGNWVAYTQHKFEGSSA